MWPVFESADQLEAAYQGFFYLDITQFLNIHVEFSHKYENFVNVDESEKVLEEELKKFKTTYKLKM